MRQLAIFDLDGTLLNTITDLTNACNYALEAYGFPGYGEDEYRNMVGHGVMNLLTSALPENSRDDDTLVRVHTAFQQYYNLHANDNTRPYPGILPMLHSLREQGTKIAVLSNKTHSFTDSMVRLQFPGLIDLTLGARDSVPLKPNPAAVLEILAHFGADKAACVYVGDSDTDMQTGLNAGLKTVGVSWGYRTRDILLAQGASVIVDKVEELTKLLVDK